MNLMEVSNQWRIRPSDQRFLNLPEVLNKVSRQRALSTAKVVASNSIIAEAVHPEDDQGIKLIGANGGSAVMPTHFSFGKLAGLAGAPAGYLRTLHPTMVADCLNWGLSVNREVQEVGVLVTREDHEINGEIVTTRELRAATGPNYGRVWNEDLVRALMDRVGDGMTGDWRVPGYFGKEVKITRENTTLYASDRDMHLFLCDERNRLELPNRRANRHGTFARGLIIWNSEVGDGTLGGAFFLFDEVCENRIIWQVEDFKEMRLRHTSGAPARWLKEIQPVLTEYVNSKAAPVEATLKAAQRQKIDDVKAFLRSRQFKKANPNKPSASGGVFTASEIASIEQANVREEGRPIETLWDVVTGITAHAKTIDWQDERVAFERAGGKVLELAAVVV